MSWHSVWHFTWYSIWHMLTFSPALHLAFYLTFSAALYLTFNFFFLAFRLSFYQEYIMAFCDIWTDILSAILSDMFFGSFLVVVLVAQLVVFDGADRLPVVVRFPAGPRVRLEVQRVVPQSINGRPNKKKIWHVSGIWFVILSNMFFAFFISLNWHATWQRHSCWHISDILSEILSGTVYGSDRAQKANKFATEWLSRGYWHTTWPRHVGKDARSGKWMSAVCVRVCVNTLSKTRGPQQKWRHVRKTVKETWMKQTKFPSYRFGAR